MIYILKSAFSLNVETFLLCVTFLFISYVFVSIA